MWAFLLKKAIKLFKKKIKRKNQSNKFERKSSKIFQLDAHKIQKLESRKK